MPIGVKCMELLTFLAREPFFVFYSLLLLRIFSNLHHLFWSLYNDSAFYVLSYFYDNAILLALKEH